ncbi:MAG: hypothetical protein KBA81_04530 [Rhabdochlamydiaceae bacterium]|nr:hypothetical protein [Rhabdochlamydiaceae bacterium]
MWARVIEFMLACWLAISPFIFAYPDEAIFFWVSDFGCSVAIAFFAFISFYDPLKKMHLCNLFAAFYLIALGFCSKESFLHYALQNYIVLGILLLMLAIIPTDASQQPKPWRDFYNEL